MIDFAKLRSDCENQGLSEREVSPDPFVQFDRWYAEAISNSPPSWFEVNAMSLSTSTRSGHVSSRTVLLKQHDENGFVFFTSYDSDKGQALAENPQAALLFHWAFLARQIRIEGPVEKTTRQISEEYFHSRPRGAQISASVSAQSRFVATRQELEVKARDFEAQLQPGEIIPLPDNWGGFRVIPKSLEFWQGRKNRLHDRLRYQRDASGHWLIERLCP